MKVLCFWVAKTIAIDFLKAISFRNQTLPY
jgi:hypothetical protein